MSQLITGIHHVTVIASDAQKNIDFYTGFLGLRLVKKTVNFDGPDVYHFYYGDEQGTPGSILTFFPYQGLVNGRHGKGALNTTTFSLPSDSLNYWLQRFKRFDVAHKKPQERFEEEVVVYFEDDDGLGLELVFSDKDSRKGFATGPVPPEHSIRGFYNVEIWQEGYERTAALLTEQLDHKLVTEKSGRFRFAASDAPGHYIDILCTPESMKALSGSGTVHHIAFATPNKQTQEDVRLRIVKRMLNPSPILDRTYFTSVYFREPGGVLFEIATEGPGFTVDEQPGHLGEALQLPPQFSSDRASIESKLVPVTLNLDKYN
ncbi:VOC family protein [Flavisolibacter sp. BT320]|nr:VOC family protein [Flavisolibacter longurius]